MPKRDFYLSSVLNINKNSILFAALQHMSAVQEQQKKFAKYTATFAKRLAIFLNSLFIQQVSEVFAQRFIIYRQLRRFRLILMLVGHLVAFLMEPTMLYSNSYLANETGILIKLNVLLCTHDLVNCI
jgi:hypothetical protein